MKTTKTIRSLKIMARMIFILLLPLVSVKAQTPIISYISPNPVVAGGHISIVGTNLASTTGVHFAGGNDNSPVILSDYVLYVSVPADTLSAPVTLTGGGFTESSMILTITSRISVSSVTISPSTATVAGRDFQFFTANVLPSNATDQSVVWSASSGIGDLYDGNFTAGTIPGVMTITATSVSTPSVSGIAIVTVTPYIFPSSVSVSPSLTILGGGNTMLFTADVLPSNTHDKDVNWSVFPSSGGTILSNGTFTANTVSALVTITAASVVNPSLTSFAVVSIDGTAPIAVLNVSVSPSFTSLVQGDTQIFTANILPSNASDKSVTWSTIPFQDIASDGTFTAPFTFTGLVTITATSVFDPSKVGMAVVSVSSYINVTTVTAISSTLYIVPFGGAQQFYASVLPYYATNTIIDWYAYPTTSGIIDQSSGIFYANNIPGILAITAVSRDNPSAFSMATVTVAPGAFVSGISISPASAELPISQSLLLTANIEPANATDKRVNWYSYNPTIGTVLSDGTFYSNTVIGIVTITAQSISNPSVWTYIAITVTSGIPVSSISISPSAITIPGGNNQIFTADVQPSNADQSVVWSVFPTEMGNCFGGTFYPNSSSSGPVTITATSISNITVRGIAVAMVNPIVNNSITQSPYRSEALTLLGFYTSSPPQIDGNLDDYSWNLPTQPASSTLGGAGFDGTSFPVTGDLHTSLVREQINILDPGTIYPDVVPSNPFSNYAPFSATVGVLWDSVYLYVATKVIDPIAAASAGIEQNTGVSFFFNNGNGRSGVTDPINEAYPRKYNNYRDMQVQIQPYTTLGTNVAYVPDDYSIFGNYGISMPPSQFKIAIKKTSDGYIVEGRIAWSILNKEFIDPDFGTYSDDKWKPTNTRTPLGFDMQMAIPKADFSTIDSYLSWNMCCYNANWSRSKYYGYLQLVGANTGTICPSSINVSLSKSLLSQPMDTAHVLANLIPDYASHEITWNVTGVDGNDVPLATVNQNTGLVTPLGNGIVTITGVSDRCPGVSDFATLTISGQIHPESISVSPNGFMLISGNNATFSASVLPSNAANKNVTWSIYPSELGDITSDGYLTSHSFGVATITATSIADSSLKGTSVITVSSFAFMVIAQSQAVVTSNGTIITWPSIPGAFIYCIKYSTDSTFTSNVVTVCGLVYSSYTITSFDGQSALKMSEANQPIYWQVAAIDENSGATYWSTTLRTEFSSALMNLKLSNAYPLQLYPNPSNDIINIKGLKVGDEILIYDVNGQLLLKSSESPVDITSLASGIYVARVNNKSLRFVKQ